MHNSQLFCTLLLSCRAEGRRPAVETSRPIGAFTFTNHTRSAQPAKDETFECSPSPGVAADCRRKAPNRPAVMLSGGASPEVETSRPDGTFSGANRTGSRPSDRRDSSTAPAASLGMTITSSVTLSGASAESKGLEFAEHSPVRFARALANPPSRPLDCARGDSLCRHVERRGDQPRSRNIST